MIRAITTVADNLKSQPLLFALLVLNVMFVVAALWVLRDVASNSRDRFTAQDKLLAQMAADCFDSKGTKR